MKLDFIQLTVIVIVIISSFFVAIGWGVNPDIETQIEEVPCVDERFNKFKDEVCIKEVISEDQNTVLVQIIYALKDTAPLYALSIVIGIIALILSFLVKQMDKDNKKKR